MTSIVTPDLAETAPDSPAVKSAGNEPPRWLCLVAVIPATGVLSLGSVGLVLAVNGWYRPALAFPIGIAVWVGVLALVSPLFRAPSVIVGTATREAKICAAIGVVAIVAITAWNMGNASTHILIDRDGGSYTNTGRWIARDGSLTVEPRVGPFAQEPTVGFDSQAVYARPDGNLQFQFAHFLPVVLAEAYDIAGDTGLFHTPELLSGLAMLAFFVLAWRLIRRPLFALAAMLALSLTLPQVSFARDSYSEIPSQLLLFSALWLLVTPRVLPRWRLALAAGLFLGALEATRIDAVVFLIGVPVVAAIAWLRSDATERRSTLWSIAAFGAGLVPGMLLGFVDLARHSGGYWGALRGSVMQLAAATAASFFACVFLVVIWRFVVPIVSRLPWNVLSNMTAGLVAFVGFAAWVLRPRLQHLHGKSTAVLELQKAEHLTIDATRIYYERSLTWMSWYLGPLTLATAIIGAALLVRALLRGRELHTIGAIAILVPGSMLYLYMAKAAPDHVWVTRRFLVAAMPTFLLLALGLASRMYGARARGGWARAGRVAAIVVAVVAVAFPVYTIVPVRAMAEETGYLDLVHGTCRAIGPNAVVLVLEASGSDQVDDWFPQAIRGWCGVEVGVTRGTANPDALHRLARSWDAQGKQMFVVARSEDDLRSVLPDGEVTGALRAVDHTLLAPTLSHRPDAYRTQDFSVVVAAVPPR